MHCRVKAADDEELGTLQKRILDLVSSLSLGTKLHQYSADPGLPARMRLLPSTCYPRPDHLSWISLESVTSHCALQTVHPPVKDGYLPRKSSWLGKEDLGHTRGPLRIPACGRAVPLVALSRRISFPKKSDYQRGALFELSNREYLTSEGLYHLAIGCLSPRGSLSLTVSIHRT